MRTTRVQNFVGRKAQQRATVCASCLQRQLSQFVRIIRRFLGKIIINSSGNNLQIVIYGDIMTNIVKQDSSKCSEFERVRNLWTDLTVMESDEKSSHLAMPITWESVRICWEI